jgi:hypothetical protein
MDQSYIAENDAERARLQALAARLTDADMARPTSEGWTVGVGLLHLAFWDRLSVAKFEEWERTETVQIPPCGRWWTGSTRPCCPGGGPSPRPRSDMRWSRPPVVHVTRVESCRFAKVCLTSLYS